MRPTPRVYRHATLRSGAEMKNVRIGTKVVGVVLFLALIALSAAGFATLRMTDIGSIYAALIHGSAKEAIVMARANRMVAATRADLFAIIAETDPEELKQLTNVLDQDKAKFHDFMDQAKAARSEDAAKVDS